MGQPITILSTRVEGDIAAFDTDRGISGQDGSAYGSPDEAAADPGQPGQLASRIFEADAAIDHVFVASNLVVARRPDGWDEGALNAVSGIIGGFFVFYAGD